MSFDHDFKNKTTEAHKIYYSQYIAAWINVGGTLERVWEEDDNGIYNWYPFREWLLEIGCTEYDARQIFNMATNGKLELEELAKRYLSEHKDKFTKSAR